MTDPDRGRRACGGGLASCSSSSVFRPLSNVLVPPASRISVAPPAVVLANAAVGLVAALVLARGELIAAAVLLQVKTLLDNMDGQLARASGR